MLGFMPDTSGTDSREPLGRVVVLEDDERRRQDGSANGVHGQADSAAGAQGPRHAACSIGEPPNLWLARDTNGDLKADTKDLVRNDYGRLEGNPEHNANSLHWGLDNVIYTSEHTYHLKLANGKFEALPDA